MYVYIVYQYITKNPAISHLQFATCTESVHVANSSTRVNGHVFGVW
jgi:hypothetical protein